MKYQRTMIILTTALLLCGCSVSGSLDGSDGPTSVFWAGGGQEQAADQNGDEEERQPDDDENSTLQEASENNAPVYVCFDNTVLDMESGGIIFRTDNPRNAGGISSFTPQAAGSDEMLFVLTRQEDEYLLTALGRDGSALEDAGEEADALESFTQNIDTMPTDKVARPILGYYQGKYYLFYDVYHPEKDQWVSYAYCYERQSDGSFVKAQDTLCETVMKLRAQGYSFCGSFEDVFTCLNEWDFLLVWKQEKAKVSAFGIDGNLCWERSIDPEIMFIEGTDGRFLVGTGAMSSPGYERNYYIYDFAGTYADGEPMRQGSCDALYMEYLGMHDGYVYYQRKEAWAYLHYFYSVFRSPLDPAGEEELLYETADVPGLPPDSIKAGDGFGLWGDLCYFINFDEGSLWWYSCDLSDGAHPLTRLGLVREYTGLLDVGEISYEGDEYSCPDCEEVIYKLYAERLSLSEEVVPYADVINPVLFGITEDFVTSSENQKEHIVNDHSETGCDGYFWKNTFEWYVKGTTQYSFHQAGREGTLVCLEVDYSGYEYYGGAHGFPLRNHYFFNLADGSEMSIGDIVCVSEEEFRVLAAEYTVEDCRENPGLYFYVADGTDPAGEQSLYDEVYEYAGFDILMNFSEEGVVIEYSPYHLGPFASGYIEVTIPYEELGLELVDCYGAGKTW